MSLAQKYEKSLRDRWCMRFRTTIDDGDDFDGIVTHIKRNFIVLRELREMDFDGVVILPKKVIRGYRDNQYEDCSNAIIRKLGTIKKAKAPRWLDSCDTLSKVFVQLKKRDIWPAVETDSETTEGTTLYLGPIARADAKTFELDCYDATAKWEQVYEIKVQRGAPNRDRRELRQRLQCVHAHVRTHIDPRDNSACVESEATPVYSSRNWCGLTRHQVRRIHFERRKK